jgi:3-oxoacyl-[acyl-carrier protein] reductase
MDRMRLSERVAIITGAAQGIGRAYAERFLAEGARVVIADFAEEQGRRTAEELRAKGDVLFVHTDISDEQSALECARLTRERFGAIDILVNNAAIYAEIDYENQSYAYLKRVFEVNLHGAWLMARAAVPAMVEQRRGRILNQSSDAAYLYVPKQFVQPVFSEVRSFSYNQTKWGIVGLTKFLAVQLGQYGITVNCISPGPVLTDATRAGVRPARLAELEAQSALKRVLEPEDLAGTAVFFASDDAAWVTGQVLCVDAGLAMPG